MQMHKLMSTDICSVYKSKDRTQIHTHTHTHTNTHTHTHTYTNTHTHLASIQVPHKAFLQSRRQIIDHLLFYHVFVLMIFVEAV